AGSVTEVITAAVINNYLAMNVSARDENGQLLWSKDLKKQKYSYWNPKSMILDGSGHPIIAGEVYNSQELRYEIFVTKLDEGEQVWFSSFSDEKNYVALTGMLTDESKSNVYLSFWYTEFNTTGNFSSNIQTMKLDGSTGTVIWEDELKVPNQYAVVNAIARGPSGIYQTGYKSNAAFGYDIRTIKYDEQGNYGWQQSYSSAGSFNYSIGLDLSVNSAGTVVVAGTDGYHTLVVLGYASDGSQAFIQKKNFGENAYLYNAKVQGNGNGVTYVAAQVAILGVTKIHLTRLEDDGTKVWRKFVAENYLNKIK